MWPYHQFALVMKDTTGLAILFVAGSLKFSSCMILCALFVIFIIITVYV